jgi:hypothetical protein
MSGEYTETEIRRQALPNFPIEDLEENATGWSLGVISLSKSHPSFSYGFSGSLNHDSRFRKQPFTFTSGAAGVALIFRRSDDGGKYGDAEEWFCGWVPLGREPEADRWIKFLNHELRWRLVEKREREGQANASSEKDRPVGTEKKS